MSIIDRTLDEYIEFELDNIIDDDLAYRRDWYRAANRYPTTAMKDYKDNLDDYVDGLGRLVDDFWQKRGKNYVEQQLRLDANPLRTDADPQAQLKSSLRELDDKLAAYKTKKDMSTKIKAMTRQVRRKAVNNFQQDVARILGDDFQPFMKNKTMDRFIQQTVDSNTRLIKSIHQKYHTNVEREIYKGIQQGRTIDEIKDNLDHEFTVAKSRTKVIAMDQTNSLHSAINRAQHKNMGLEKYKWYGILDSRIRLSHESNHGSIFKWSSPPSTGHPGDEIACRCYAYPIKEELQAYASSETGLI